MSGGKAFKIRSLVIFGPFWAHSRPPGGHGWPRLCSLVESAASIGHFGAENLEFLAFFQVFFKSCFNDFPNDCLGVQPAEPRKLGEVPGGPREAPERPQEASRRAQEASGAPREASWSLPGPPRNLLKPPWGLLGPPGSSQKGFCENTSKKYRKILRKKCPKT